MSTLRSSALVKLCATLLLCASLPSLGLVASTKETHSRSTLVRKKNSASHKNGNHAYAYKVVHGKRVRVPRTLRTIPVSHAMREDAVERVEADLTESAEAPFLYPAELRSFFDALAQQQRDRAAGNDTGTIRILQFGDSHTAADIFTGEMRARMQQQFGDGGLGFQFPGHPFAGYHLAGSLRAQSAGWHTEGNHFTELGDGDLGLGGISISTERAGETIALETTCTALQLQFLKQPGGGKLEFSDNGVVVSTVDTSSENGTVAGTYSYSCPADTHDFEFRTLDHAPVKLLGLVTEQPGITYECLGINGAIAPLMLRWNQNLFSEYLRDRSPNLIVLAYGTNEAAGSAEHLENYPAEFDLILDNLHRLAPQASILVLGPADRATISHRAWQPFNGTERIIEMQKEACRTHGCAFWDTQRRMGGLGSMRQWVTAGWAQPDRTHLTGTGYRALADALYTDMIHAYNVYEQHANTAVEESSDGQTRSNP